MTEGEIDDRVSNKNSVSVRHIWILVVVCVISFISIIRQLSLIAGLQYSQLMGIFRIMQSQDLEMAERFYENDIDRNVHNEMRSLRGQRQS